MKILGVTGSMGMGKSTVCSIFRAYGFPVFDADYTVHQLQKPYGKALPYIAKEFPMAVQDGYLDRNYLRNLVKADTENLRKIERIILPLVANERGRFIRFSRIRKVKWCVLDIPLLFEKNIHLLCDKVIVVKAPMAIQKMRILKRGKISWEQAQALIAQQLPTNLKCKMADYVIRTGLNRADTFRQVNRLISLEMMDQK